MQVAARILHTEIKTTAGGTPFAIVYYQEIDDTGNAFGKPVEVSSFDSDVVKKCQTLTPNDFYHLDLTVQKAYLAGVSKG